MIFIYGTRGLTQTKQSGVFLCPACGDISQPYLRKSVRRWFTLFFVPVVPLDHVGEYIECQCCGSTFNDQVLTRYPAERQARIRAEFREYVKRIMVLTALADGKADGVEIDAIRAVYEELAGATLSRSDVERELVLGRLARKGLANYPRNFPGELNRTMKEQAMRAALAVASADGEVGPDERGFLVELAAEMGLAPPLFPRPLGQASP